MIRYTIKAIRVHAEHPDNEVVFTIVDLANIWEVARWHMQQRSRCSTTEEATPLANQRSSSCGT